MSEKSFLVMIDAMIKDYRHKEQADNSYFRKIWKLHADELEFIKHTYITDIRAIIGEAEEYPINNLLYLLEQRLPKHLRTE